MKPKILVVEDIPEIIKLLSYRLRNAGFDVMEALDGETGLRRAREDKPDLIVLDLMLPKIDGYKICRLLKFDSRYEHIPVIMLTARAMEQDRELGYEVGADAYFVKPPDPKKLVEKIQDLLERRPALAE